MSVMDRKFLGIKIGTIVAAVVCLVLSFFIWMYVRYEKIATDDANAVTYFFGDES